MKKKACFISPPLQKGWLKTLLLMKLSALLILVTALEVSAKTFSQDKLDVDFKKTKLAVALKEVESKTDYRFAFSNLVLSDKMKVTLKAKGIAVEDLLNRLLENTGLSYNLMENKLVVITNAGKELEAIITVKGRVTDSKGDPLSGVNISAGKGTGTTTNKAGEYSIEVDENATLTFSYVGYTEQSIKVNRRTSINITLVETSVELSDVVVVGYGKQARSKLTSSVATVKTDQFKDAPYTNLQSALQGRVAGVIVNVAGGEPGSVPSLTIRGGEPLIGRSAPLYVIDGIIRDAGVFTALNVNDIAEISFLKDAAATAVYGAQGGAGIVLVTTKQGVSGKPVFTYANTMAWNTPNLFPKLIDSYNKALVANAIGESKGNGQYSAYSPAQLDTIKNGWNPDRYPNTDWYKLAFRKYAMQQNHNLSMTGGTKQSKYYIGLGYFNQGSNYIKSDAERLQRFSYNTKLTSSFENIGLEVTAAVNGYYSQFVAPPAGSGSIFSHIVAKSPLEQAFNKNGSLAPLVDHPLAEINSPGYYKSETLFNNGTLTFDWQVPFVKGLSMKALGDYNFTFNPSKSFDLLATQYNADGSVYPTSKPSLSQAQSTSRSYTMQYHVNYAKSFRDHNFEATFVYEQRAGKSNSFSAYRPNFQSASVDQLFAGDASQQTNNGNAAEWGNLGYIGRFKYDYASKYLVELSGRIDGSDGFKGTKKFAKFPSASLGWVLSKEKFYERWNLNRALSFLKLRATYGKTGSVTGRFAYLPVYNLNSQVYVINGQLQNGYSEGPLTMEGQDISWFSTTSYDAGVDFAALNNQLKGSVDYFYTRTTNIVGNPAFRYTEPLGQALPLVLTDAATRKEGVDFNLTYTWKLNKNLSLYAGANFTYFNYVWEKTNEDSVTLANPQIRDQGVVRNYYAAMYNSNGLYQNYFDILNNPTRQTSTNLVLGDVWYQDINGDGKIDGQDQWRTGKPSDPRFVYGITLGGSYKGFTFDVLIQGTGNRNTYLGGYLQGAEGANRVNFAFQKDFWTANNTGASFPRAGDNSLNSNNNYASSDFWLINTRYVRLKSLTLNYDFKSIIKNKASFLNQLSVNVGGTNLITLSPCKKYFDPELANNNNFFYPVNKTFSAGVRLSF